VNSLTTPTFNPIPAFCAGTTAPVLPSTSLNGITGTWFPATVSNTASGTYTFTPNTGQCASTLPIIITVNSSVTPTFNPIPAFCAGTTAPVLPSTSLNGITGTWFPATVNNTTSGTYTFTPNAGQCTSLTPIQISTIVNSLTTPTFNPIPAFCAGTTAPVLPSTSLNGITGTWFPVTVSNTASGTYTFTPNVVAGQCYSNKVINITVLQQSVPDFEDLILCENQVGYVLSNQSPNGIIGTWSPATINFTTGGNYTFTPNSGQCATTQTILVTINSSSLTDFQWIVSEPFSDNPTITIIPNSPGNYLYQLDFGPQQTSNVFQNVSSGFHTVQVVDINGCSNTIKKEDILIIDYPKFFTPNDDGYNDTWNINDLFLQNDSKIYIYDRYGKLLKQIFPSQSGWDGKYNNSEMFSDDYWFVVEFEYNNTMKLFKAHFALKR
jgi:gliding motility-associated-like protein